MTVRAAAKKVVGRVALRLTPRVRASATRAFASGSTAVPQTQDEGRTPFSKDRSKSVYEYGAHRSDAEARIAEVPVVMVDGAVALCDGGKRWRRWAGDMMAKTNRVFFLLTCKHVRSGRELWLP